MQHTSPRSPTTPLYIGLVITLLAVVGYSGYVAQRIASLRELQHNLIDRNRRDSLQLLRIQNELDSLGMSMRDMLEDQAESGRPHSFSAWEPQFARMKGDLADAFAREREVAPIARTPEQDQYLFNSLASFWQALEQTFSSARNTRDRAANEAAREQIRGPLQAQLAALSNAVARQLVQNNESEERAAAEVSEIYDHVQRQAYFFGIGTLIVIVITSLYLIRSNRLLFNELASLSARRSELAQTLISTQESTLRYISRELHDEFGQILTAMGAMLGRARNLAPEGSALRSDLLELREIAQGALEKVRSLSQALHPVMLDEAGLEQTIEWYLPVIEKQTGIRIIYEKTGSPYSVGGDPAVHVYRVLQEALNNMARHSGAKQAWVGLRFAANRLELEVEDRGLGFNADGPRLGLGLIAMRERAELLGGTLSLERPEGGGTRVRLQVPKENLTRESQELHV